MFSKTNKVPYVTELNVSEVKNGRTLEIDLKIEPKDDISEHGSMPGGDDDVVSMDYSADDAEGENY